MQKAERLEIHRKRAIKLNKLTHPDKKRIIKLQAMNLALFINCNKFPLGGIINKSGAELIVDDKIVQKLTAYKYEEQAKFATSWYSTEYKPGTQLLEALTECLIAYDKQRINNSMLIELAKNKQIHNFPSENKS